MTLRPIDIARRLNISTSTLRKYEDMGLAPRAARTPAGYRAYTPVHLAYFSCVREMLPAFELPFLRTVLERVQARDVDGAFWLVTQRQAALWAQRQAAEKFAARLGQAPHPPLRHRRMLIHEISQKTGIAVTTIRHWEKAGLITPLRDPENRYRYYTDAHAEQLLTLHTIRLSVQEYRGRHFLSQMKEAYDGFDRTDPQQTGALLETVHARLSRENQNQMQAAAALCALCRKLNALAAAPCSREKTT